MTKRADCEQFQRVRVVSVPGRRDAQNSYFSLLWCALEDAGAEMLSARTSAALTLQYDILHLHFPEHLITERPLCWALIVGPLFLAYVVTARMLGKKFVWTIHEVNPTRRYWLAQPYLWCLRNLTNAYIFMNRTSENAFFQRYPDERRKIICKIPHSSYPVTETSTVRRGEVRASLTQGVDCLVVGLMGEIRPYKNPAALQFLPATIPDGRPVRLVVAGAFHASCNVNEIETMLRKIEPKRFVRIKERLSDERLSEMIQSIDLVFMPYLQGWNSGFAMFALGCGARLLCSALPMFQEIEEILGPPWIYSFDHNAPDLSQELTVALVRVSRDKPDAADRARLDQFLVDASFERAASRYMKLYTHVLCSVKNPLGHAMK
jgi:hypothetical protein